jgi:hypothetical protein
MRKHLCGSAAINADQYCGDCANGLRRTRGTAPPSSKIADAINYALYTLIETAKASNWNPTNYLTRVFEQAATMRPSDDWGYCSSGTSPPNFWGASVN